MVTVAPEKLAIIPVCSLPKSQGMRATGHVGFGQGNPTGSGLSLAVTPAWQSDRIDIFIYLNWYKLV